MIGFAALFFLLSYPLRLHNISYRFSRPTPNDDYDSRLREYVNRRRFAVHVYVTVYRKRQRQRKIVDAAPALCPPMLCSYSFFTSRGQIGAAIRPWLYSRCPCGREKDSFQRG